MRTGVPCGSAAGSASRWPRSGRGSSITIEAIMIPLFVMLVLVARGVGATGWQPLDDWQVATRVGLAVMFAFTAAAHFNSMRADLIRIGPPRLPHPAGPGNLP